MKHYFTLLTALLFTLSASAQLKLPAQVSDYMVLQQQTKANLWGYTSAGKTVSVTTSWNTQRYTAKADKDGRWLLCIDTPEGSFQERQVTISDGTDTRTLQHVLIGEVWMASGQSNMQMPMKGFNNCPVEGYLDEVTNAYAWKGRIRMATLATNDAFEPLEMSEGEWKECTPATMPNFSATAYFFAQTLTKNLNVPVGILANAWGGSRVEGWLPKHILESYGFPTDEATIKKNWPAPMHHPMVMNNGQFWPIRDYTIKGVIWYQGCTNGTFSETRPYYAERVLKMINYWREVKHQPTLPVYMVQIAQFAEGGNPDNIEYALLREQQFRAAKADEQVYLASLHDVYVPQEMHQVHSSKKRIVGLRLGSMALGNTYALAGYPREVLTYSSCKVEGDKMLLTFDNWMAVGGWGSLVIKGMEISGADGVWHPAQVQVDGYTPTMTVFSPEVKAPVAVRYGFRNFSECTLSGANGLGAYPFRTDHEDLK